jgi:hypothetical protein
MRLPGKTINNTTTTIQTMLFTMINLLIFEVTVIVTVPLVKIMAPMASYTRPF